MANRIMLLVGAGHAHLEVLRQFARRPVSDVDLLLLTRQAASAYSGMVAGHIAGRYSLAESHIQVAPLVDAAGGWLLRDEAIRLDTAQRRVLTQGARMVPYDIVSINIGSDMNISGIEGAADHAIPVKPIDQFLARFAALRRRVLDGSVRHIACVGGGAAGVELVLAMERRLRPGVRFTLVTEGELLPGFPPGFRTRLQAVLRARRIDLQTQTRVTAVTAEGLLTATGTIAVDAVLLTTQAAAPGWVAGAGLAADAAGFLKVDVTLQSLDDPRVFAAGDVAAFKTVVPRSGAAAVRAGMVLAHNLRTVLGDGPLRPYRPRPHGVTIIGDAEGGAVATRNGVVVKGRWVAAWKERRDRRFIARYRPRGRTSPADQAQPE